MRTHSARAPWDFLLVGEARGDYIHDNQVSESLLVDFVKVNGVPDVFCYLK